MGRASVGQVAGIRCAAPLRNFSVFWNDSPRPRCCHGLPLRDMLISMPLALSKSGVVLASGYC